MSPVFGQASLERIRYDDLKDQREAGSGAFGVVNVAKVGVWGIGDAADRLSWLMARRVCCGCPASRPEVCCSEDHERDVDGPDGRCHGQ